MSQLANGLGDVGRGLRFLNAHRGLWKWVIAPALVTLLLLIGIFIGAEHLATSIAARVTGSLPSWLAGIGSWLIWAIVGVGLVLGALLMFVTLAGIVAGPFNEMLSEAVEEKLTGRPGPPFALRTFVVSAARGLVHGLRRIVISLLSIALLFGLGFIPVIGAIVALVLGGYIASRGAAYDCYDAVLSRRPLSYADKLAYLAKHRGRTLGLGMGVAGMLFVPGLNLLALGIGAAGATLAAHELAAATVHPRIATVHPARR
ncbi:MAG: EI24 domain-containing protein [Deltaproteobacteria bacterium]|nr:EI24 domain-containing protein [Deltaproteobacteria bacterium]